MASTTNRPDCAGCGQRIEGVHGVVWQNAVKAFHPECVADPTRLTAYDFKQWTIWSIRALQGATSARSQNLNDLVDALEELHPGTRAAYERILLRG